jgi:hypothetical protein
VPVVYVVTVHFSIGLLWSVAVVHRLSYISAHGIWVCSRFNLNDHVLPLQRPFMG